MVASAKGGASAGAAGGSGQQATVCRGKRRGIGISQDKGPHINRAGPDSAALPHARTVTRGHSPEGLLAA